MAGNAVVVRPTAAGPEWTTTQARGVDKPSPSQLLAEGVESNVRFAVVTAQWRRWDGGTAVLSLLHDI